MSKKRILMAWVLAAIPLSAVAEHGNTVSGDKATDMVVDIVVVRPLGLVTTVVGAVLTVVALPFTLPSGSVGASAHELIVKPADYTFNRPLGEFYE